MYSITLRIVKRLYLLSFDQRSRIRIRMQTKNEQVGFRISADLKRELQAVAKREGRTLSQLCEILLAGGLETYKKEGSRYLQRLLSHHKKEPPQ